MGGAGIAAADSGKYTKNPDGSIVFYPYTSGDARGLNFNVSGSQQLCADGPTDALQEFVTNYKRNRTLQPDLTEKTVGRRTMSRASARLPSRRPAATRTTSISFGPTRVALHLPSTG